VTRVLSLAASGRTFCARKVRIEIRIATVVTRAPRTATAPTVTTARAAAAGTIAARATGTPIAGTTGTTTACETIATTAALATRTTRTAIAAGATAAWTTWTTSATRTATTWTTATTTTATITEVARCGRQLPADSGARHLTATGTIIFLLLFLGRANLEATEAARLVAIAATAEATAATTTTAAGSAATATLAALTTASTATAALVAIASTARRSCDAIDHVVELAARDRVVRTLLALEHAHEAHLVDAVADDVERLDETRGAIRLNAERCSDGCNRSFVLLRRFGLRLTATGITARGRGLTALGTFGARCLITAGGVTARRVGARALRRLRAFRAFERRRRRARVGGFAARCVSGFDVIGCGDWRRALRRCTCRGCITQQEGGELGQRLHREHGLLHQSGSVRQGQELASATDAMAENETAGEGFSPAITNRPESGRPCYAPPPACADAEAETSTETLTFASIFVAALTAAPT
jgi:hypothetical protein